MKKKKKKSIKNPKTSINFEKTLVLFIICKVIKSKSKSTNGSKDLNYFKKKNRLRY